jgi:hypothetical protein
MLLPIPTKAGPDTICECYHWFEEHQRWEGSPVREPVGPARDCGAPGCECPKFKFCPKANTIKEIADRGGDPDKWPMWMKQRTGLAL